MHTPEFPFEKDLSNVQKAVRDLGITYPVALDNDYNIWNSFNNEYWPAHYFIDANGNVRFHHFGEGEYDQSERWIQELLKERNAQQPLPGGIVDVKAKGAEAAPDMDDVQSPETYIGYERAQNFASPGGLKHDNSHLYAIPSHLDLKRRGGLAGNGFDHDQTAILASPGGQIGFRFHVVICTSCLVPLLTESPFAFGLRSTARHPRRSRSRYR